MVFLTSMLSAFVARTWFEPGMVYAFLIGLFAEVIYFSFTYRLMRNSEDTLRTKYTVIIEKYKERELLYEQKKMDLEKSINMLKKKNDEKEHLLEYEKKKAKIQPIPQKTKKQRDSF